MVVSYNKLWKLLIDKKMNKNDLRIAAGVSTTVINVNNLRCLTLRHEKMVFVHGSLTEEQDV
jgi:DNA-binding Xre family transcriptional regulator